MPVSQAWRPNGYGLTSRVTHLRPGNTPISLPFKPAPGIGVASLRGRVTLCRDATTTVPAKLQGTLHVYVPRRAASFQTACPRSGDEPRSTGTITRGNVAPIVRADASSSPIAAQGAGTRGPSGSSREAGAVIATETAAGTDGPPLWLKGDPCTRDFGVIIPGQTGQIGVSLPAWRALVTNASITIKTLGQRTPRWRTPLAPTLATSSLRAPEAAITSTACATPWPGQRKAARPTADSTKTVAILRAGTAAWTTAWATSAGARQDEVAATRGAATPGVRTHQRTLASRVQRARAQAPSKNLRHNRTGWDKAGATTDGPISASEAATVVGRPIAPPVAPSTNALTRGAT